MSIDDTLIRIFKKNSRNIADKDVLPMDGSFLIKKIAFDVYKVDNDPYEGLWGSQEIGGENYLVRLSNPTYENKVDGDWSATSDFECSNITLSYKNAPLARFSSDDFGFVDNDIITFKSALLDRVKSDSEFVFDLLKQQPEAKISALCSTFPELNKMFNKE